MNHHCSKRHRFYPRHSNLHQCEVHALPLKNAKRIRGGWAGTGGGKNIVFCYSKLDQDNQLTYKVIIQKLTQIIAKKPPQRVAIGSPQRVPAPLTSVSITTPETICTSRRIHQRQTLSNKSLPSIIEEIKVWGVLFQPTITAGGEKQQRITAQVHKKNKWDCGRHIQNKKLTTKVQPVGNPKQSKLD